VVSFNKNEVIEAYQKEQPLIQASAKLVDNGRAGTLSRIKETIEFAKMMNFRTLGLAYCYGMENDAKQITGILRSNGFKVEAASCTVGGILQNEINQESNVCKGSCNPIGQAQQLNKRNPELVISMGLCMGHEILFNRELTADTTTLVVKDRLHKNQPLLALSN